MKHLILRNIKLYFRDRLAMIFSLMSIVIMLGLYICFLADVMLEGELEALENGKHILNLWLLAGLLSIASMTTTFASYGIMVHDISNGIMKDFLASSVPRWKLYVSYIITSWLIGMMMSMLTLLIGEFYLFSSGGQLLNVYEMISVCGVMVISVGAGSSISFLLASFLSTSSAFANASTLLGTLIGFLMGIYIPIGTLPDFAQTIIRFFPMSQGCSAYRQVLVQKPLHAAMENAPSKLLFHVESELGITLSYGSITLNLFQNLVLLGGVMVVCYGISMVCLRLRKTN